jgi:hypothetical protein
MPQSPAKHNNTIGLTGNSAGPEVRQNSAILRLTRKIGAHISAAPTANGAYRNVARICDEGFCDPKSTPEACGLDLRIVRSMHRLFGKGYAGGGEHQCFGPWVDARMFSSSLVRMSVLLASVQRDRQSNLVTGSKSSSSEEHVKLESLILAQNERWRQA